jgi:uracil-DNA glycosylase family 4
VRGEANVTVELVDDLRERGGLNAKALSRVASSGVCRGPDTSPNCGECPFAENGKPNRPVRGIGPGNAALIAVGEGPGRNEVSQGIPFVGASGKMLNRALGAVNVDRDTMWVTNATLCQPPPGSSDSKKKKARECCAPRLQAELRSLPASIPILALGGVASQGFLGDKFSITKLAGSVHDIDVDGRGERAILPTIHPAAILRGGDGAGGAHAVDLLFWNLLYDVSKIKRLAAGDAVRFSDDVAVEIESPAKAHELVLMFAGHARTEKILAVDVESVGTHDHLAIEPMFAKMTAIGLATPELAVSVPYPLLRPLTKKVIAALLADSTIDKVMHNRIYDTQVLARHGMPARGRVDCTLLMHHSAFPGLAHDLQRVSTQFFCIGPWKAKFRADDNADVEELCVYNARDSLATARLRKPLRNCLKGSDSERTYDLDSRMAVIAERMSGVGVPISREVNATMQARFNKVLDETLSRVRALATEPKTWEKFCDRLAAERAKRRRKKDPPDYIARHALRVVELEKEIEKGKFEFSVSNADHIAAYLKARGVSLYHQTETGRTSTKREVLEGLGHVAEVADIVDFREAQKMNSTFVAKLPHYMDADGRIHPIWSVNKITGRWGAEHPQVMNWPKADPAKNRPNLREQVVAPPGRIFVGADFAQLEARIIAMFSHDKFLCEIFHNNKDIHSEFARIVWPTFDNLPVDQRKRLRDMIKRPEYGALYGAAVQTMYEAVSKDYPEVKLADLARMNDIMKSKMTGVEAWHQQLLRDVAQKKEIRSAIYGRRRCFPLGNAEESTVYNFPVQATGADIMDTGLERLVPELPPTAEVILQLHDAAVVECDEDDADKVSNLVTTCLSQEHTYEGMTIQYPADAEIGRSWADV